MSRDALLLASLECAVPLRMAELRGLPDEERQRLRVQAAEIIASHGDDILYRGHRAGDTARAWAALVNGLALLSEAPGGVSFAGLHFGGSR